MTTLQMSHGAGVFQSVLKLGRPKFLFYSAIMHGVGVAAAYASTGHFDLPLFLVAQGFVTTLHLATHYCNEFFDLGADRMNATFTRWTGGSRGVWPETCRAGRFAATPLPQLRVDGGREQRAGVLAVDRA